MFKGSLVALITTFRDHELDEGAFQEHVAWQIDQGTHGLVPCGTTGESPALADDEQKRLIGLCVEVAKTKRVPVIAGTGTNSTEHTIALTRQAKAAGADAALIVCPYYNKPTQQGYFEHFKAIAEAEDIPIIVYNVPGRTGGNIEAKTMLRLAEIPNIVAVKEASGNLAQIMDIIRDAPSHFRVLSGDDALALAVVLLGGDGVVSVISNEAPAMMSALINAALESDIQRARELHYKLLPLMNANFIESNPIPVKAALAAMGMIEEMYRLPLVKISEANREKLLKVIETLGLLQTVSRQ